MSLHSRIQYLKHGNTTLSRFSTEQGVEELFLHVNPENLSSRYEEILESLERDFRSALTHEGVSENQLLFSRVYFSDIANQLEAFRRSALYKTLRHGGMTLLQQTPVLGSPIQVYAYYIASSTGSKQVAFHDAANSVYYKGDNYSLLYYSNGADNGASDSGMQTNALFNSYINELSKHNLSLRNNTIRTWLYVRDIDIHYHGMVRARRGIFDREGLTEATYYPASTGIGGTGVIPHSFVAMDAIAFGNIQPGQITRMDALTHMSRTIRYGVTFERGLRLAFGDRSHLYVSGTASIDHNGDVVHAGNTYAQTTRTIDNIEALLKEQGAALADLAYIYAYVRDHRFARYALDCIQERFPPDIPCVFLEAPVCRPSWLVEIEGTAIIPDKTEFAPFI